MPLAKAPADWKDSETQVECLQQQHSVHVQSDSEVPVKELRLKCEGTEAEQRARAQACMQARRCFSVVTEASETLSWNMPDRLYV